MYAFICIITLGFSGCENTNNNNNYSHDNITISSNGHIIQNSQHFFSYYYYIGESIVFSCQSNSSHKPSIGGCDGKLTSNQNGTQCKIKGIAKLNGTYVTCEKSIYDWSYEAVKAVILRIYFFQRNDPEISLSGFPNETDGRYPFSDSETLNLTCTIKKDYYGPAYNLSWFFDEQLHAGIQTANMTHVINEISFSITKSDGGKKIKCEAKENRANHDNKITKFEEFDDSKLKREVILIFYEPKELLPASSTYEAINISYGVIAMAILALIFIVSCIIILQSRKKKKKKMTPNSNEENEINFSQSHKRIEQSKQSTECLYSEPTDSRKSNYAASKSIIYPTSDVYTAPYKPKDVSEMYAKPIPKAYRKKEAGLHYAEIETKENSKVKTEDSYHNNVGVFEGNVLKTSENTDNSNEYDYVKAKNAYSNVFNGEPYMNAESNRKDEVYTEPAYCEVPK